MARAAASEPVNQPLPGAPAALSPTPFARVFTILFGCFLGLSLLKFGNPPIMEKYTTAPADIWEFIFGYPWPISWAYILLGCLGFAGLLLIGAQRPKLPGPAWLVWLPAIWFVWQFIAGTQSVDWQLSSVNLEHFAACVGCFYIGLFCLGQFKDLGLLWIGLWGGLLLVLVAGWEQHFGGLAETRRYFFLYVYPQAKAAVPPEYLKKIASERIFATLFYPNALAGVLLLLLPPGLTMILTSPRFTLPARRFLAALVAVGGLACLFWSGSKGGWLLMLLLGLLFLFKTSLPRKLKFALVLFLLVSGLAGFWARHAVFFGRGATSVVARFDYWQVALKVTGQHPLFGTGPGTFSIPYQQLKKPDAEMTRLAHNDYLEQACDSGLVGFLTYAAFIFGSIALLGKSVRIGRDPQLFAVWLGLLGWTL
ncbi:MAG TPA: O-antigen ligase family protein, partial [Candidatus Dormibacteraeota bacterium]|nr:O-antigen ligase family protein [Candidatus Dormibacteraeota bacterium]